MTDSPEPPTHRTGTDRAADRRPAWVWAELTDGLEIRFFGRAPLEVDPSELARLLDPTPDAISRLVQVHSDQVVEATPGVAGEGDALVSTASELALAVATADCVPLLLAGPDAIAAVHAGWRGLVAGVIDRTLDRLPNPHHLRAWIGPAIGACCYEVSSQVAERVAAASTPEIVTPGRRDRPHIDLRRAATDQLAARGVETVRQIDLCTRCHADQLWSYRRDGSRAGRNWAVIWRRRRAATVRP